MKKSPASAGLVVPEAVAVRVVREELVGPDHGEPDGERVDRHAAHFIFVAVPQRSVKIKCRFQILSNYSVINLGNGQSILECQCRVQSVLYIHV